MPNELRLLAQLGLGTNSGPFDIFSYGGLIFLGVLARGYCSRLTAASSAKAGDRVSSTQIWTGRNPCSRNRSRWRETLSREGLTAAISNLLDSGYM